MNTTNTMEKHYMADGKALTVRELGLALYHISRNTDVSKRYTLKFVEDVLLRASELLLEDEYVAEPFIDTIYDPEVSDTVKKQVFDDIMRKNSQKDQTWCGYHGAYHPGSIDHECPAQKGVNCGCCEAGRQYCMKKKANLERFEQFGENYLSSKHRDEE